MMLAPLVQDEPQTASNIRTSPYLTSALWPPTPSMPMIPTSTRSPTSRADRIVCTVNIVCMLEVVEHTKSDRDHYTRCAFPTGARLCSYVRDRRPRTRSRTTLDARRLP